jgi:hypothetical protein
MEDLDVRSLIDGRLFYKVYTMKSNSPQPDRVCKCDPVLLFVYSYIKPGSRNLSCPGRKPFTCSIGFQLSPTDVPCLCLRRNVCSSMVRSCLAEPYLLPSRLRAEHMSSSCECGCCKRVPCAGRQCSSQGALLCGKTLVPYSRVECIEA